MRLPLVAELDSRDGEGNKDGRLTNMLLEQDENAPMSCVRPALVTQATSSGNGNGLFDFDGVIVGVFGTGLVFGASATSISTVIDADYDFAQAPI